MKPYTIPSILCAVIHTALTLSLAAQDSTKNTPENALESAPEKTPETAAEETIEEATEEAPALDEALPSETNTNRESELDLLSQSNSLRSEQLKATLAEQREEFETLQLQKKLLAEKVSIAELKLTLENHDATTAFEQEKIELERQAMLAKIEAEISSQKLKSQQAQWSLENGALEAEIKTFKAEEQREAYLDREPTYLENPLQDNKTLVISDRRIAFNGAVTSRTADYITSRIHFYNNQDPSKPIFIVIDDSPGGSVMAGYRILKSMEASDAPIHVVVKSFAASMAASITTLAEHSYAYPNAIILHHQISTTRFGRSNLTEQRETFEDMQEWWKRLATPIAEKMGITNEDFIRQMYEENSSGDWVEFADQAQKLNWVDHIVERIEETSALINPDKLQTKSAKTRSINGLSETVDSNGEAYIKLPRLNPKDVYFLHNPDHYYRLR